MRPSALFALVVLATPASAFAQSHNLILSWRPTNDVDDLPNIFNPLTWTKDPREIPPPEVFDGVRLQVLPFTDKRKDKTIGANVEHGWGVPITTSSDVGEFVGGHFGEVLQTARVDVVESNANRLLKGEIVKFYVSEDNTYNGSVVVRLTLTNDHGKVLWEGLANGRAKRAGHSLSPENYNETFSDAVVDSVADLLKNWSFLRALAPNATTDPAAPTSGTTKI